MATGGNETLVCVAREGNGKEDVTFLGSFAILALGIGVGISMLKRNFGHLLRAPFTLIVFLVGMLLGAVHSVQDLGALSDSIRNWRGLDPEVLLFIFLPPLLFVSAFEVEYHVFRRLMGQAVLLATVGVLINVFLIAGVSFSFGYGWTLIEGLLFGSMFGATDPVAVVALLHELGAPETLSVLIEGESLLNDGVGFVLFIAFFEQLSGREDFTGGEIVLRVLTSSFFGLMLGVGSGLLGLFALQQIWEDTVVAVALTVVLVWGTFFVSEALHVSGVIAVVALGIVFAAYEDGYIQYEVSLSLKRYWKKVEYMVNTVLFGFSGGIIVDVLLRAEETFEMTFADVGNLVWLFLAINVIRAISVAMLFPVLKNLGYGFSFRRAIVVSYAGLRGAVGLIAALLVAEECSCALDEDGEPIQGDGIICLVGRTQNEMIFMMAGIVLLTLAINGTTSKRLVNWLKLNKQGAAAHTFFERATVHVHDHMEFVVESLKRHPHYKNADWDVVWKHMPILSRQVYEERKRTGVPHNHESFTILKQIDKISRDRFEHDDVNLSDKTLSSGEGSSGSDLEIGSDGKSGKLSSLGLSGRELIAACSIDVQLKEARHRFLSLVKASYRRQFHEGANRSWPSVQVLIEAASRCQDKSGHPINEWDAHLKDYLYMDSCWRSNRCYELGGGHRLAEAYNIAGTFVRAHKSVIAPFQQFTHEAASDVVEIILEENALMIEKALDFTETIELSYPEVARSVKTNIAIQRLLKEMENYAHKMLDRAEIDEKDFETIERALEDSRRDLRRLRQAQPQTVIQVMRNSSFFLDVNVDMCDMLMAMAVPTTFLVGDTILSPDELCENVFLIVRGKVEVTFEDGVQVEKTIGDALGTVAFVTGEAQPFDAIAITAVETMRISHSILRDCVAKGPHLLYNMYREAGLMILESQFPQFQFASFSLLKFVLPHVRVVRGHKPGRGSVDHKHTSVMEDSSLARRGHSVVSMSKPILFHGGLVICLTGDTIPAEDIGDEGPLQLLTPHTPHGPLFLEPGAVLMHVSDEAVTSIREYDAFDHIHPGQNIQRLNHSVLEKQHHLRKGVHRRRKFSDGLGRSGRRSDRDDSDDRDGDQGSLFRADSNNSSAVGQPASSTNGSVGVPTSPGNRPAARSMEDFL
ncbi:Sodium/hydrogen exchanger 8 (Na(+)/H(+) exchanger 8) (NHE-8) (Protein SALT OVERLY SENSITIVE 1B) [Durusdinium trenchii]|uniref:Sodium/hydrogen exchanger 8 (Na(+)/H(+) exchanger 8) (NHE-8) (Protein SALT OVERLY SENSITIVE 1B) n=1 Tax=Durusdinium trenchii TaxID=1381693 RepID=A0ABP0KJW2_9DINO